MSDQGESFVFPASSMQILVPGDVRFVKNLQIAEAWNFNKLVKNV